MSCSPCCRILKGIFMRTFCVCYFQHIRSRKYESREKFLIDVNQIVENCKLYNGRIVPHLSTVWAVIEF